jgi:hypothetical protein
MHLRSKLRGEDVTNDPLFVDDIGHTPGYEPESCGNTIGLSHFSPEITQQNERQAVFIRKPQMRLLGVGAYADDFSASLLKDFITIPKRARLSSAASSIIFGLLDTGENDVLPCTCRQSSHGGDDYHDPPFHSRIVNVLDRSMRVRATSSSFCDNWVFSPIY